MRALRVGLLLALAPAVGAADRAGPSEVQASAEWADEDLPPAAVWSEEQRATLASGLPVYTHLEDVSGRQYGSSAVLVRAAPSAVWEQVLDYDDYVVFLPYITASKTISRTAVDDGVRVQASYELTTRGLVSRYLVESQLDLERNLVAFTLTPVGGGPVVGGSGWWRLTPWEDGSGRMLLEYTVDLGLKWWVPGFVERQAADRGLPVLVRLMGVRAEKQQGGGAAASQ